MRKGFDSSCRIPRCLNPSRRRGQVSFESTSRLELVLYPLVMLIMLLLSVAWFVPLSQGTAKVWRERSWSARAELLSDPKTD